MKQRIFATNIVELFYNTVNKIPDKKFIVSKEHNKEFTYKEFADLVEHLSGFLYDIGLRKGDKVAILSDNLYKWLITDLAILSLGAVDVPRGSDTTVNEINFILNHSDSKFCFVENCEMLEKVIKLYEENKYENLKSIILFTGSIDNCKSKTTLNLYNFDEIIEKGKDLYTKHKDAINVLKTSIKPDDLATLIYTSGTTGVPKGVMLTHDNITKDVDYMMRILFPNEKDRWVSVLPVWHVYERTVEYAIIATGGLMAYAKPGPKLIEILDEIKPTWMVSVPRIWELLYNRVMISVKSFPPLRRAIFNFFTKLGVYYSKRWKDWTGMVAYFRKPSIFEIIGKKLWALFILIVLFPLDFLGNILVYKKIREKLGGKLKTPISGGGKLPDYLDDFFTGIKIKILEGYGLTETSPVICVRTNKTLVSGTVGRPIPETEIMIGDENFNPLPDQTQKGIIYCKSRVVMKGYYKNPEATLKVLKDGWFNTGDLGRKTITGEVQIVGRAKETIVLTGGENIEPVPIEEKLTESEFINYVMLVGQDKKYLGALIVPNPETLTEYAKNNGITDLSIESLCKNEKIIELYKNIIKEKINVKNGFKPYENIKYFRLLPKQFEINDELTRTLKIKRNVVTEKYEKIINEMYEE